MHRNIFTPKNTTSKWELEKKTSKAIHIFGARVRENKPRNMHNKNSRNLYEINLQQRNILHFKQIKVANNSS